MSRGAWKHWVEGDVAAAIVGELATLVDRQSEELTLVSCVGDLD